MTARGWSRALALVTLSIASTQAPPASVASMPADQRRLAQPLVTSTATPSDSEPAPPARVVRLDAVVTDRQGKAILTLGPEDIEVVENGVVQKLNAVELRRSDTAVTSARSAEDERSPAGVSGGRLFAFLLDEYHVGAGLPTDRVREALTRFIDEELRDTDLLAVLKPLDSVTDIRFTRDHAAARGAVQSFSGRRGEYAPRSEFERKYIGHAPEAVAAARSQIVLSGLRALTSKLDELDTGRSAVVLVTEGFVGEGRRRTGRRIPDAQGLVRAASRANVAIYTFDPTGSPDRPAGDPAAADDANRHFLETIAAETGGVSVRAAGGFAAGLQRVARDLDAYYVITYTSSHTGDGRFYDVQVRAKPAGAIVRTRSGYWAPVRTDALSRPGRRAPARMIRKSPLIETWLGLTLAADGTTQVTFTWIPAELQGRKIAGLQPASVVGLKVTTPEGAVLFEGELASAVSRITGARPSAAVFDAAPGRIQFDLAILAADGTQVDQAAHDLDLPEAPRADPLILAPQVFSSSSAREFRQVSSDPAAAPIPSREFRRTERLLVRVPTYSRSGAAVTVSARLLNRSGQALRAIPPMRSSALDGVIQFDLPLSWLAPGEYSLELTAKNAAGAAKELVRLRVTG